MDASLFAFLAAAALLTVTPGVDTAYVLRTALGEGRKSGALAGLGIALGCLLWGATTAAGLSALLAASEAAYALLKWAGAAYLGWLGLQLLLRRQAPFEEAGRRPPRNPLKAFRQGLLTNILNPKVGVFYVSFLPQFIPADVDVGLHSLLLAAIHAALGLLWFAVLIMATAPIASVLARPAVATALDRITGGVFLLFAAKLALEPRA